MTTNVLNILLGVLFVIAKSIDQQL